MEQASWTCAKCGAVAEEVDHIVRVVDGGSMFDVENLQPLCRDCHIDKTRSENERQSPERDAWREYLRGVGTPDPKPACRGGDNARGVFFTLPKTP